ncbi:unnamed protein product [Hermetia illucens]|uniref:Uncharacterized protein n=1 Tax=Hermetia illucens TaxID=343691 RepID=A0A7R8UAL2_HERIL|nr:unnamed protein product [Hermetia illucens]
MGFANHTLGAPIDTEPKPAHLVADPQGPDVTEFLPAAASVESAYFEAGLQRLQELRAACQGQYSLMLAEIATKRNEGHEEDYLDLQSTFKNDISRYQIRTNYDENAVSQQGLKFSCNE